MKWVIFFSVFGFFLFSCDQNADNFIDENPPQLRTLSAEEESLIESSNSFVFELLNEINQQESDKDYFFSPLSVQYALAMTLNGSGNDTFDAIKAVLNNDELTETEINESYKTLTAFLLGIDKTVLLKIANSVWYREDLSVKEAFKIAIENYYDAGITGLDFNNPVAKETINGWVAEKTEDLITDLIDQIPNGVVIYLINAIYFKAEWQYKFDKNLTDKGLFILEDGSQIQTDMMQTNGAKIHYFRNTMLRLIDIPYGNGQFSMCILVPTYNHSLEDIISSLDRPSFSQWLDSSDTATSKIYMPKFKIEYKTLLNDILSNMGMAIAFTDGADLSRLFDEPLDLFISRVIHQAVIEVNEEGSEAAAATAVEIMETSLPPEPENITINEPFIFFIREKHSSAILFAGKLMDPR